MFIYTRSVNLLWIKIWILGGFSPFDNMGDMGPNSDMYKDPMFNPMLQYEQAYMYYRYLTMQMEYKIKCKEYEKMTARDGRRVE